MWEGLRGRVEANGTATVLAVPAYLYDINFGDRVKVMHSEEDAVVATGLDHDASNFTFRIMLKTDDPDAWQPLATELAQLGCILDVMSPRFFAVSCNEALSQLVADKLFTMQNSDELHYETGRTQLPEQKQA